jgi:hypothetical protein
MRLLGRPHGSEFGFRSRRVSAARHCGQTLQSMRGPSNRDTPAHSEPPRSFSLCPSCLSRGSSSALALRARVPDPVPSRSAPGQTCHWELSGFSPPRCRSRSLDPHGVARMKLPCVPLCGPACIAGLWRGCRNNVMRPPWSVFRMPPNRHPGRKHISACKRRAAAHGSVTRRRRSAGLRSASRGRPAGWRSSD